MRTTCRTFWSSTASCRTAVAFLKSSPSQSELILFKTTGVIWNEPTVLRPRQGSQQPWTRMQSESRASRQDLLCAAMPIEINRKCCLSVASSHTDMQYAYEPVDCRQVAVRRTSSSSSSHTVSPRHARRRARSSTSHPCIVHRVSRVSTSALTTPRSNQTAWAQTESEEKTTDSRLEPHSRLF